MINYETLFILDPALEDEKKEAAIQMVKDVISTEGEVGEVDVWGLKKLAYPIQKKNEGYYVVIEFQAEAELPKELDRRMRISDAFMRHIIVNKEEEMKNAPKAAPKAVKEEAPKAEAPAEEAPVAEAPVEEAPAEEAPVEE
ncbi:MAG: 30S ribosomal protein S6 [Firmicutes bacterium]|nr:30S ribosomal protein S6 [Bacillota bacterium]